MGYFRKTQKSSSSHKGESGHRPMGMLSDSTNWLSSAKVSDWTDMLPYKPTLTPQTDANRSALPGYPSDCVGKRQSSFHVTFASPLAMGTTTQPETWQNDPATKGHHYGGVSRGGGRGVPGGRHTGTGLAYPFVETTGRQRTENAVTSKVNNEQQEVFGGGGGCIKKTKTNKNSD